MNMDQENLDGHEETLLDLKEYTFKYLLVKEIMKIFPLINTLVNSGLRIQMGMLNILFQNQLS